MKFRQLDNPNRFGSWYHDNLYSLTNTTKKDSFFVTLSDSDTKRTFPWGQEIEHRSHGPCLAIKIKFYHVNLCLVSTVWKMGKFADKHILREINYCDKYRALKSDVSDVLN